MGMSLAVNFEDLDVYQSALALAMRIFEKSKGFPSEEKYSLRIKLGDVRDQSALILQNPGANADIPRHS